MEQRTKSNGPFVTIGIILGAVGSTAVVLDNTIKTGGDVLHQGLTGINTLATAGSEALEAVAKDALEELREDIEVDSIIRKATNEVRIAQATKEAAKILATLETSNGN